MELFRKNRAHELSKTIQKLFDTEGFYEELLKYNSQMDSFYNNLGMIIEYYIITRDKKMHTVEELMNLISNLYNEWKEKYNCVGDVRGLGAMIGLELVKDQASKEPDAPLTAALIQECAQNGLLIENAGTYGNVIRFLAPLVMTDEQLECGLDILEKAIAACSAK